MEIATYMLVAFDTVLLIVVAFDVMKIKKMVEMIRTKDGEGDG